MGIDFEAKDSEIIQTIKDSAKTETIKVEKDEFLTREVYLAPHKPMAAVIACATLTALVDYLNNDVDKAARETIVVHIESPTKVSVVSQVVDREDRRFEPITVKADTPQINLFGSYVDQEAAMIELQSKFVQEGQVIDILSDIGNIVLDEELSLEDDGITQKVVTQSGIDRSTKSIENPVFLQPFRTFAEIEQPESPFVLRLRKSGGLSIALFEADGGKWRNDARQKIKDFLTEKLTDSYAILA